MVFASNRCKEVNKEEQKAGWLMMKQDVDMLSVTLMIQKMAFFNSDLEFVCKWKDATQFLIIYPLVNENL